MRSARLSRLFPACRQPITGRFPYPQNTALASHLESLVRLNGGIPATIGVLNGTARVGLNAEELIELTASAGRHDTKKVSHRDLGYICGLGMAGRKLNGGTTIAGTMVLAHLAGIRIFATGGLGGVHRDGENSMDISADLTELGRTPVAVVSSGCKSFLDIPKTLEYLETQGVYVGTFADGRPGKVEFPAFWTRDSGISSPTVIQDEQEAAAVIHAQSTLGLSSGLLFANPVPAQHSVSNAQMHSVMTQAVLDAKDSGSTGSENTPFILARIRELTGGQTVTANRALVESNVIRGTKVACGLAKLRASALEGPHGNQSSATEVMPLIAGNPPQTSILNTGQRNLHAPGIPGTRTDVFVAGSLAIDLSCDFKPKLGLNSQNSPRLQTSNPAAISQALGGVGHNIATAIHYLGTAVQLCSIIGDDQPGATAKNMLIGKGLSTSGIIVRTRFARTAQYVAVNDSEKNLVLAMADMAILEGCPAEIDTIWKPHLDMQKPKWLVVDANWDSNGLQQWLRYGKTADAKIAFEPVSVAKAQRIFASSPNSNFELGVLPDHAVSLTTPNAMELASMHTAAREAGQFERDDWWQVIDAMTLSSSGSRDKLLSMTNNALVDEGIPQQSIQLLPFIPTILTKLGNKGVLMTQILKPGDDRLTSTAHSKYILSRADVDHQTMGGVYMRLFPPAEIVPTNDIVSVNGVGDTFLGIIIAGLAKENPKSLIHLIHIAQQGSIKTLKSKEAVSPEIKKLRTLL
ncbi:MAG: hypothetical protein LQ343_002994 [Gyalolechia ehrenbergii]|nr:MAG: hypothetical protein LQ343_002994 [Gyalolechia ehrenbergii]